MSRHSLLLLASLLCLFSVPVTLAQEGDTAPAETFFEAVDVNLVNVEVFVTDRKGEPVLGLERDDFQLLVDGQEIPFSNFYGQAVGRPTVSSGQSADSGGAEPEAVPIDQRLHLVVFVDNLHLTAGNRKRTFKHLREFLDSSLRPGDLVTVVSQNQSLFIHGDFLSDRAVINDMLDEVADMASFGRSGAAVERQIFQDLGVLRNMHINQEVLDREESPLLSQIRAQAATESSLADASLDSLERLLLTLGGVPGRKAMIHVSDGIPVRAGEALYENWLEIFGDGANNSFAVDVGGVDLMPRFRRLGRIANASGVTLYAINAETDHSSVARSAAMAGGAGGIVPINVLEMLNNNPREGVELTANTTGGRWLQRTQKLTETLGTISRDFESFYSLGFQAPEGVGEGDRQIEVKVEGKGLRVRHRETFRSRSRDDRSGDFVLATLLYGTSANPLGISLETGERKPGNDGNTMLTVLVKIPIGQLALVPKEDKHSVQVSFFVSVKSAEGDPRPVQKIPFHLHIPADRLEDARGREAAYPLEIVVRPGDLQAVVAVRDDYAARESAVRIDLDR